MSTHKHVRQRGLVRQRQDGQILVLFALSLVAMVGLVALVIDGGNLYLQRRTAQASGDAAAMAGARALRALAVTGSSGVGDATVATAICTYALANAFAVTPSVTTAEYVQPDGTTSAGTISLPSNCSGTPGGTDVPSTASGVRVSVRVGPYNTFLAPVVGVSQLSADGHATAQVGILTQLDGDLAPFGVCGSQALSVDTASGSTGTTSPFAPQKVDILIGDGSAGNPYRTDPTYFGWDFILESSQMSQNQDNPPCPRDGGTSWKGKLKAGTDIVDDGSFGSGSTVVVDNGAGTVDTIIRDICTKKTGQDDPNNFFTRPTTTSFKCRLLIPVVEEGTANGTAVVRALACFDLWDGGNNLYEWRGILRETNLCPPIGNYTPTGFTSMSTAPTRLMLTN